jgi:hypothetical protein
MLNPLSREIRKIVFYLLRQPNWYHSLDRLIWNITIILSAQCAKRPVIPGSWAGIVHLSHGAGGLEFQGEKGRCI